MRLWMRPQLHARGLGPRFLRRLEIALWNAARCASAAAREPTPGALKARLPGSASVHASRSWPSMRWTSCRLTLTDRDFHQGSNVSPTYESQNVDQMDAAAESVSMRKSQLESRSRAADSVGLSWSAD